MSAKKRRRKAKLVQLRKMDATYSRLYLLSSPRRDGPRAWRFWFGSIIPLGDKLERQKAGAWDALLRGPGGGDVLMHNYFSRKLNRAG